MKQGIDEVTVVHNVCVDIVVHWLVASEPNELRIKFTLSVFTFTLV